MKIRHPLPKRVFLKYVAKQNRISQRLLGRRSLSDREVKSLLSINRVWPGTLSPLSRHLLQYCRHPEMSDEELIRWRLADIRWYCNMEQRAVAALNERNSAEEFIRWFDSEAAKAAFFRSRIFVERQLPSNCWRNWARGSGG